MKRHLKWIAVIASILMLLSTTVGCSKPEEPVPEMAPVAAPETAVATEEVKQEEPVQLDYPKKDITLVVPFAAGATHDLITRAFGSLMSERFGVNVVVQNIAGSGGLIGSKDVQGRPADGYTIAIACPEVFATDMIKGAAEEGWIDQWEWIGNWSLDPGIVCVAADSPYNTLEELMAAAKAAPGELRWASTGTGGKNNLDSMYIWKLCGDANFTYVPYGQGVEARTAVQGGHAEAVYNYASESAASVQAGELKALVVTSAERLDFLPDVPTLKELGMDAEMGLTRPWCVKKGTPTEIVEFLEKTCEELYNSPEGAEIRTTMNAAPGWMTGEELKQWGYDWFEVYSDLYAQLMG